MSISSEELAIAWIEGWIEGRPDDIPLAPDFVHHSPFGTIEGREVYLEKVKPMAANNVVSLNILKVLAAENEAAIWFEMSTPHGVIPACDWVETEGNQIKTITSFYDATELRKDGQSY